MWRVEHGDCLDVMRGMADNSVDAVITDPPYGLSFMGKRWDYDVPSIEVWAECLRVLKPGGHLLAFGGTRTYHRMAVAIEDAGFEIRDSIHWLYGSGFPKSLDVSKAIDKAAGAEREVVGVDADRAARLKNQMGAYESPNGWLAGKRSADITAPATDAARQWEGWGTALKPAHEPIVVARKPLAGTVAANVLSHGTGALNIDGCRVATTDNLNGGVYAESGTERSDGWEMHRGQAGAYAQPTGRWPANIVLTHAADCVDTCAPGCPVYELDLQSGTLSSGSRAQGDYGRLGYQGWDRGPMPKIVGDSGGASRFFTVTDWGAFRYVAKPGKAERNAGLDGLPKRLPVDGADKWTEQDRRVGSGVTRDATANFHPTVKPLDLMRWLVRLVTPPDGTVLDPFAGSGTTLVAARLEGFAAVGIEMTADYLPIIEGRLAWAAQQPQQLQLFTEGDAA